MTRQHLDYTAQRTPARRFEGFDPDTPVGGFYRFRQRSGAIVVGVRIAYGPPADPVTGEILDRSHRWQAFVNDRYVEMETVWPKCAEEPCDEAEYRRLCGLQDWATAHAPALANPLRRIDPNSSPTLF